MKGKTMTKETSKTSDKTKEEKPKKTPTPSAMDKDKSFSERDHGRTHDSPKTKVHPKTL